MANGQDAAELISTCVEVGMGERFASILFWFIILVPIGVFARQLQLVRSGARRKFKGTVVFFSYSILPASAYAFAFLALVGIEEIAKWPVISEGFSRNSCSLW